MRSPPPSWPWPADDDAAGRKRRAEEVREIGRRLVRNLTHAPFRSFSALPEGAVLVCENLRPADAALLDPSRLAGVATDDGGSDGHTAIMLRALGVPSVLGVAGLSQAAKVGRDHRGRRLGRHRRGQPVAGKPGGGAACGDGVRPRAAEAGAAAAAAGGDTGR